MCIEIICEECIRDMAQTKEYSEKDFLYSGYTDVINDAYCNKTDVQWGDLIQESCNKSKPDTNECYNANRNKPLCANMKIAKNIMDKTHKHPGFDQQYVDAKGFSDMSVLNLINLGIGIVAASVLIAKTYK